MEFLNYLSIKTTALFISLGAALNIAFEYIFKGMPNVFPWFLIFVLADYLTGMLSAFKNKEWSSSTGFKGIVKKILEISLVVLFNGIACMVQIPEIETGIILAFALNELCSILENITKAGYESIIPASVYKYLKILKQEESKKLNRKI